MIFWFLRQVFVEKTVIAKLHKTALKYEPDNADVYYNVSVYWFKYI